MCTSIMYVQLYYYLNPEAQSSREVERERDKTETGRDKQVVEKVRLRWALNQLMSKILV